MLQRSEQAMVAARRIGRGRVAHADVRTSEDPIERAFQLSRGAPPDVRAQLVAEA